MTPRAVVFAYHNVGARCLRVLRAHGIDVPLVVTHADDPGETQWFERVADVGVRRKRICQRLGIEDRLGGAVRSVRPHHMRGVAEQCHAIERPARQRIAIDHRELEDLRRAGE